MIAINTATLNNYTGDNTENSYVYTFKAFEAEDVAVKVREDSSGVETDLVLNTHFTLTGVGSIAGGSVILDGSVDQDWMTVVAAPDKKLLSTYTIYIYFLPNIKQLTKFRDLGRNSPVKIEEAFDRLTMVVQAFFSITGNGDVARALKLPTSVLPSEFDPTLPEGFDSAEDNYLAVNAALNGFKVVQNVNVDISYIPGAVQSIANDGAIAVALLSRQHVRVKSTTGALALNAAPFGTNPALLKDGMEIVVEADDPSDTLQINESNNPYGFQGNGGILLKYPYVATFVYNATKNRFLLKSNGAW